MPPGHCLWSSRDNFFPTIAILQPTSWSSIEEKHMNVSRRDLLKLGVSAAALCATGVRPAFSFAEEPAKKIPIGLQLYSIRDITAKDMAGSLENVAKMGYQGVEFAGYFGKKAKDLRKMLDQNGLKCCGSHTGIEMLLGDSDLKATIEYNQVLGNKFIIVPWLPTSITGSISAIIRSAKQLTEIADKAQESGIRVGYHSHAHDFKPVADRIPWEVLFSNAGPNVVMQIDTGNCMDGGGDPVAEIKKFPHRTATIHLKEHGGPKHAVIGEGDMPWKEVFAACETVGGTEWYIAEQETFKTSSLESVKLCLENLRKMGK
jgi:sugar phosphate isomerase/epimerase